MDIGLEVLLNKPQLAKNWGRCALLCNQASVNRKFTHATSLLRDLLGDKLAALLGPQHGFISTVQDNMIESNHATDRNGIPVYSLYSETREPTKNMLEDVDTILIDLQIVGCRVYTFKATVRACLTAAQKFGKKVVVLDRPNPLGGVLIEGRSLDANCRSFVGPDEIPMRHGLTIAECAQLFNREIGAKLEVVPMESWKVWEDWGKSRRPWVLTSPNLPTWDSVSVYPGLVLLEGTNISEGRGTTLPFQLIGAPYISNPEKIVKKINDYGNKVSSGLFLRPTQFLPLFGKWANNVCHGFQIHVLDHEQVKSYALGIATIHSIMSEYPKEFLWKEPPYEYEYTRKPIVFLIGSDHYQNHFDSFKISDPFWREELDDFLNRSSDYLIYPRERILV